MTPITTALQKQKIAFTLIEMIIVVVVIGILAVALIPRLQGAQERTKDVVIKKDLSDLTRAVEQYYSDNGSYAISGAGLNGSGRGWLSITNIMDSRYPNSIMDTLYNGGYLSMKIKTQGKVIPPYVSSDYVIFDCLDTAGKVVGYTWHATLYNPTSGDLAAIQNSCVPSSITSQWYLKNYAVNGGRKQ